MSLARKMPEREMNTVDTCVFCDLIASGRTQQSTVNRVVQFEPLNPVTPGHMLFVPKRHASNAAENPTGAAQAVLAAAQYIRQERMQANIITSIGPAATQSVWHTHVHVVPRTDCDGLTLPWTGQAKEH